MSSMIARALALLMLLTPALAMAEEASVASKEQSITGGTLALVVYIILWAMIAGFFFVILSRQKRAERDLQDMEARVAQALHDIEEGPL